MQQLPANRSRWATVRRSMRHSVIRRSLYVSLFYVTGHAFYYLLILVANSRLEPVDFGRFYLGWAILNIIAAPGAVLTTLFPWLLAIMAAVELILFFTGLALGSDAVIMIALLPLTALSSVLVDTVR